jgi:hypothetical protein
MNDSYRNPFSGVNAVQLGTHSILEYWCSPFSFDLFPDLTEAGVYEDEMNIVFMGGRSTGKSMLLRYWSFPVQVVKAQAEGCSILELLKRNRGIGYYFRIDGPTLRSFQGSGLDDDHWASVFTHYFELIVSRQYLEAIATLGKDDTVSQQIADSSFILKVCDLLEFSGNHGLDQVLEEIDRRIRSVDKFRAKVAFYQTGFQPDGPAFSSGTLSFGIPELIISCISAFEKLNLVILLDEYENFSVPQQMVINTMLRFTRPQIKFRIGMRLEGFRTFNVVGKEDFIKEGREYRKVVFEDISTRQNYLRFLTEIVKRRLEHVEPLRVRGFTDIKSILGARENLEDEARELSRGDPNRISKYFSSRPGMSKQDVERVRNRQNPLLELLNMIWLTRGKTADEVLLAMREYLDGKRTESANKYRGDYINKYKLSLVFLLCSIYKKEKQYYSFNTFSFLSSGIVGQFLELCRRSFAIAEWNDTDAFLKEGKISKLDQTRAAVDFSLAEKQQIIRIEDHGGAVSRFVENIGSIFRSYHSDPRLRYPELNQFAINIGAITDERLKTAMQAAIRWSIIQKARKMHRSAPGEPFQDTYALNRILSPLFQISYRTRGGRSVLIDEKRLTELMSGERIRIAEYTPDDTPSVDDDRPRTRNLFSEL